jgi:low temperature requirement protein LtrA
VGVGRLRLVDQHRRSLLAAILRIAPSALSGAARITAAGFVHGGLRPMLWLAALAVGFFGPLLNGMSGWRVQPAHFVERHGLIVIIAIGESLIAIGLGAGATQLGSGVIVAAVLGLVVATSFWLAYFDFFPIRAQQMLADRRGAQRTALARDVYTYLHLPMVAGIVLFAFAMKTTLAHVGDELDTIPAVGLCGGPALYLFAYVALRFRVSRTLGLGRRGRLCVALAGSRCRAGAAHGHARDRRVGRIPRVRDHLVAGSSDAYPGAAPAGLRLLKRAVMLGGALASPRNANVTGATR